MCHLLQGLDQVAERAHCHYGEHVALLLHYRSRSGAVALQIADHSGKELLIENWRRLTPINLRIRSISLLVSTVNKPLQMMYRE